MPDDATPRAQYEDLIPHLRETARTHGYALTVHGSLARDIDLVAIPWTKEAVSSWDLAIAMVRTTEKVKGRLVAYGTDERDSGLDIPRKPHGRVCWVIHLDNGVYIDLSIMPRSPPAPGPEGTPSP
jgi:hypothetical protein